MSVLPPRLQIPMSEMATWWGIFAAGLGLMVLGMFTPRVVAELGGACIGLAFTWALAARTGGPKLLVAGLAGAVALIAIASDVATMNVLYAGAFGPAPYPARTTCVVLALPDPKMLIEIEGVASLAK